MSRMPRKRPCASCPYRKDVPSGVWAESEYVKLPQYDGEVGEQIEKGAFATFGCHQADGHLCAGWAGHRDPSELLAVRMAINSGHIPEAVLDYTTDVPLWSSGQEAAEHGMAEIDAPSEKADRIINKLLTNVPGVTLG